MKKYNSFKQIKSAFFNEIPSTWKRFRIKDIVDKKMYYPIGDGDHGAIKPEMYQENGIPYIRVQNLTWHGEITYGGMVYISEEVQFANKKSILLPGDILIAKTGATIGKLGLVPESIPEANTTSSVGKVTIDKIRFDPKFILYCFQTRNLHEQIWLQASQKSAQPGFNIDDLIVFEIVAPTKVEQIKIAKYLDHQTAVIDKLIQQKEKLIELLEDKRQSVINDALTKGFNLNVKMIDSGFDFMGEVPTEWKNIKLKYLLEDCDYSLKTGPFGSQLKASDTIENGDYVVYNQRNVLDNQFAEFKDTITLEKFKSLSGFEVCENDILITSRGTIGKASLVSKVIMKGILHPCLIKIRVNVNLLLREWLLMYINNSSYFLENVKLESNSTTIEVIYSGTLANIIIPIPPITEQLSILKNLNLEIEKYRKLIDGNNLVISKLKEYRQSIISEAVTGKIDVRDWQPNNQRIA
jgi:type I restriction enzyme S subunit